MKAGSFALFAILLASVPVAHAQRQHRPPPTRPQQQPPPPTASMPPSPAALSVPDPFAGFRPGARDLYQSPDGSDRFQHLSRYPAHPIATPPIYPGAIYPGGYYPFGYGYSTPYYETSIAETYRMSMAENYLRRQREDPHGTLMLQDVPGSAQVMVDGYYVGLAEEFGPGGRALNLDAGAHRIELRAPGYEPHTFSVRIEPNSILRYRGDMQRVAATTPAAVAAAPKPAAARSFYVIPNCYAGDKPPSGTLPKGCDLKNLQTRR